MGSWIVLDGGMGRGFPELFWMAGRGVDSRTTLGARQG